MLVSVKFLSILLKRQQVVMSNLGFQLKGWRGLEVGHLCMQAVC